MSRHFARHLAVVAVAHVGAMAVLFGFSGMEHCTEESREVVVPVDFFVQAAPPPSVPAEEQPVEEAPDEDVPAPVPERRKIEVSQVRVRRNVGPRETRPVPTPEQLRERLEAGMPRRTGIPAADEDARGFSLVHRMLYESWDQPSKEEAGDRVVGVAIRLGGEGRLLSYEISRPSGSDSLDESVRRALAAVHRIPGLPGGFVQRHPEISISFKVE